MNFQSAAGDCGTDLNVVALRHVRVIFSDLNVMASVR